MVRLSNDVFLNRLSEFLIKTKNAGTIFITMKQYNAKTGKKNKNTKEETTENTCLIRAVVGDDKISTIVRHKDINKFQIAYLNLMKSNMGNSLQKRTTTNKNIKN
eukprot:TRINITY_DN14585_c0_g1_i1.p1 TRINITY_DN14585_c0_g1~~TRINITY_DN14585_c0_g1_i1.p1  ORF type:complete len:105 (-),score=19.37 TRINITY_DN14585_c0_g1_i1:80-394(-)